MGSEVEEEVLLLFVTLMPAVAVADAVAACPVAGTLCDHSGDCADLHLRLPRWQTR